MNVSEIEIILRLIIAAILGGMIGLERESVHKPAGLRTHIFVSMGSALYSLIAISGILDVYGTTGYNPAQIISGILTSVGFIGAGVIIHRSDHHVEGITTAAGIWVSAGIGVAVGIGFYVLAISSVIISLVTLLGINRLKQQNSVRSETPEPTPPRYDY